MSSVKIPSLEKPCAQDPYRQELFELIKTLSFKRGAFILASGKPASYYIDCRMTTLSGRGSYLIGRLLYEFLEPLHLDAVGGVGIGAAPMVSAITVRSAEVGNPIDGFLIRKEAKGHGTGRQVEGHLQPWMRVALVEDVVTTAGSLIKGIQAIKNTWPTVDIVQVIALVDRHEGGQEAMTQAGIPYRYLYSVREFLQE